MTEANPRPRLIAWSGFCFLLVVLIGVLVDTGWHPVERLDTWAGRRPEAFTATHHGFFLLCKYVALAAGTLADVIATAVVAVVLWLKNHRRAAIFTVGVMSTVGIMTTVVKLLVERDRPTWNQPLMVLTTYSYPSGHSSSIAAAAGIALVLADMLLRRRGTRRVVTAVAVLVALVVGADRIFLGVHHLSDVVGGYLLGASVVLGWLAGFDPKPRSLALTAPPLPEAVPNPRKKLAVVLNPVKVDDPEQFKALVESLALSSGFASVAWWETTVEDTGHGMAHDAAVSGADVVMAVGGDGTIRAVCEELAGTGIPVGVVPAGTGNLLARNLDIPLYLRAAVDVALNGQDRAIDMVEVSGDKMEPTNFLVMAGMGFDAAIMEGVNEDIKARVGWLAYVWSALKSLMFPAIRVEVSVDGGEFTRHRARTLVIGNVGFLQAGMPLLPDATIDDGQLDLVLLYPRRFLSWIPLALRVLTKNKRTDETITRRTGQEVVVRASADTPRQLDGDLIGPGRELRARCIHGRLLVRVPR